MRWVVLLFLGLTLAVASADEPTVKFNGITYLLRNAQQNDKLTLREYLPKGERFEKWNHMVSSRVFLGLNDPEAYAKNLAEAVTKTGDPAARSQIFREDKTGTLVVDFLVFSPQATQPRFAEWNLMRVRKRGTDSLEVVQYARRFYAPYDTMPKTINAERNKLIPQLSTLKLPE